MSDLPYRPNVGAALFDARGRMVAQADSIPVHLGAMPEAVGAVMRAGAVPGEAWIVNDPFTGGTHLPDLTIVSPVAIGGEVVAHAVTRAHHADVGGMTAGSMPAARSASTFSSRRARSSPGRSSPPTSVTGCAPR